MKRTIIGTILSWGIAGFVFAGPVLAACQEPATGTDDVPMFSPPLSAVVIGTGRLQFYSAPDLNCAMKGVFIVPKDAVISYAQSRSGWSSVMYSSPRTGQSVSGWVRSARLRETGTVGPKQ